MLKETLESPLDCKEIKPVNSKGNQSWIFIWKDWCSSWSSNTLATWCKELTHWKKPWCWRKLKAVGEEDNRGWAGWTASPTQWTWVWASSGSWWWTGKPGCWVHGVTRNHTPLSDWTELKNCVGLWDYNLHIHYFYSLLLTLKCAMRIYSILWRGKGWISVVLFLTVALSNGRFWMFETMKILNCIKWIGLNEILSIIPGGMISSPVLKDEAVIKHRLNVDSS